MIRFLPCCFLLCSFFQVHVFAQGVTLNPGDIMLMGFSTNMQPCGLSVESDELSFVCFKDITTGTIIDITDNGYEHSFPGFWGDGEGTLQVSRTGGTIPMGTIITMQGQIIGGVWTYRFTSPDNNWAIADINMPGGPFNLEAGGDQVYFMQGGTWDNMGGGTNRASYDGTVIFGGTNLSSWSADGTTHTSNLHPDVLPCYYNLNSSGITYIDHIQYNGPMDEANHFEWMDRWQYIPHWASFNTCGDYQTFPPNFPGNSIEISDIMAFACLTCTGCAPFVEFMEFQLPPGTYNIAYTDGTDTFYVDGVNDLDQELLDISEDVTISLVYVEQPGGCKVYSPFGPPAVIDALFHNDPGLYNEIWVCSNLNGFLDLDQYLLGTPEPGGIWSSPETELQNGIWVPAFGPGLFTYFIPHPHPVPPSTFHCTPPFDSASVRIHFIEPIPNMEIGCDQNGTPNDITDDRITITLTVEAPDQFGEFYTVFVPGLDISPDTGYIGETTTFILPPGTATGDIEELIISSWEPVFYCDFFYDIIPPGFCSDPCDANMTTEISGPDELCVNNCPEEPETLTIEVFGGTEPFRANFSVSAPTFPTSTFNNIFIDAFTEIEICIGNVASPAFNASSRILTLPASFAGTDVLFTLLNVFDDYDCTGFLDNTEQFFTIHPLPFIDTLKLTFCSEFAVNVDLTEYNEDINPFLDVTWYDGNPFEGGELLLNPNQVNLENVGELWAHVADDYCENSIRVEFTILPSPELDSIPPVELCEGGVVVLQAIPINDLGNSMAVYTFHTGVPLDSSSLLDPAHFLPADSTSVFLLATANICYDTLTININVQDYPDFTLEAQPCDLITGTYSVVFTSSADSIYSSIGTVVNNPTGQDFVNGIPNNTNVSIEILNSTSLCTDTFLILAPNCNCPLINSPVAAQGTYEICEGSDIPVMSVITGPGLIANWFTVPSGGVPVAQNSLTFQPSSAVSAIYYVEALDPSNGCYSIRTDISFTAHPVANLQQLPDPVLCQTETINFNTLAPSVLNGVSGTGSWFTLATNAPISGTIQPNNGISWYYLFSSSPGTCLSRDTITATVNPLPSIDLFEILCVEANLTYEISFTSDADQLLTNIGNLTQIAGTDSFTLTNIPYDTDVQFDLEITSSGCTSNFSQVAPDCSCPALLQEDELDVCSGSGNVDLSQYEGLGVTGSWQLVSTPGGGNPATLSGSNFQGLGKDEGLYVLRYIRSVILADCVDTALFQLDLHLSPSADAGTDASSCAPDAIILSGNASGDNLQFGWQTTGTGTLTNPNALNTSYTPTQADITAGSVTFTLNAVDQSGLCPAASESITVDIDDAAYYILSAPAQVYCDTADIVVDLDDLITFGTTSGKWFFSPDINGAITGNSQLNPSALTAGNYTVFYTSTTAVPPCEDDTTGVSLVIQNCACPSVALSEPTFGICSASGSVDLDDFLLTTEPGSWSITANPAGTKPATITGSDFITANSDAGNYTLRFTLSGPVAGCDDFAEISLNVVATPTIQITSSECAPDLQTWQAVITTQAQNFSAASGTVTSLGGNQYLVENINLSSGLQVTATNGNGLCTASATVPAPDCNCTLAISNLPDEVALCPNESITLQANVTGGKGDVTSFWILANDSLYQDDLLVGQAGTYQFVSFDELGCRQEESVEVSIYEEMVPQASTTDITCPGDKDGAIILQAILGGNAPFFLSVNGAAAIPVSTFPFVINGLSSGNYQLELIDAFNCSVTFSLSIQSAGTESVDLGPDQTILLGDSVRINPAISFTPDSFYWTGDLTLLDPQVLDNWITPESDQLYELFVYDDKGCLYTDDIRIRVLLESSIYIPTIFSPNDDGNNDVLILMADPSVVSIEYFEIYSRWGELVFSAKNFTPNQVDQGWDGNMRNERLLPGVYVYRLAATNKKGNTLLQSGDVTLIR